MPRNSAAAKKAWETRRNNIAIQKRSKAHQADATSKKPLKKASKHPATAGVKKHGRPKSQPVAPLETEIRNKCKELADFLVAKNKAYGNSAAEPKAIFAKGMSPLAQIDVRIDDKLNRLAQGHEFPGDDTVWDLAGYLVLRMIVKEIK